jgi:asparagine synthase (glutamine-hydrolysing)
MCGILCCLSYQTPIINFKKRLDTLRPRGPDDMVITCVNPSFLAGHTRLAISMPLEGSQPIQTDDWVHIHNGEFYDTEEDRSDSYVLTKMTSENASVFARGLNGIYAYCSYDIVNCKLYVARDPIGVIPLYMALHDGQVWISSELKALYGMSATVFPPNVIAEFDRDAHAIYKFINPDYTKIPTSIAKDGELFQLLRASVAKRLKNCQVPWGVLLSGGLDSSVIAALVSQVDRPKDYPIIHSFSIGLEDSPDLKYARMVSEHIGSIHHEVIYTEEEGLAVIHDVIKALETYDVTTIRAGIPMYLLAKKIKLFGIKMVLSGEGSDELFSGYLYNHFAPSELEIHAECVRKMEALHMYDCLRANKAMASNAIECRVPFLDKDVVHYAMNLKGVYKMSGTHPDGFKIEKWLLRKECTDLLPEEILYRQKEQFSDGVGSRWISRLKEYVEMNVSDEQLKNNAFDFQAPKTKEAYYYRRLAHGIFGDTRAICYTDETIACSSAIASKWMDMANDPSGLATKGRIGTDMVNR